MYTTFDQDDSFFAISLNIFFAIILLQIIEVLMYSTQTNTFIRSITCISAAIAPAQ